MTPTGPSNVFFHKTWALSISLQYLQGKNEGDYSTLTFYLHVTSFEAEDQEKRISGAMKEYRPWYCSLQALCPYRCQNHWTITLLIGVIFSKSDKLTFVDSVNGYVP